LYESFDLSQNEVIEDPGSRWKIRANDSVTASRILNQKSTKSESVQIREDVGSASFIEIPNSTPFQFGALGERRSFNAALIRKY
jgi:hypothetical protein